MNPDYAPVSHLTRRRFLRIGAMAAAGLIVPGAAHAGLYVGADDAAPRRLKFYNLHTDERLEVDYFADGHYLPDALGAINHILRDFRRNEVKAIEPRLLDLLSAINLRLDTTAAFDVISGYRSPLTNAMLHARSEGVAAHSLHVDGKAIDIRVQGRDLATLHGVALAIRAGGVGYYPRSDFVHVDVGRYRYW
ncbi:MAG TPA: DUF882 domain-containing protein [Candidatus Binataceae bacterium]|nr:DUF882 domain-containing protein [Candidatus Binataceae bacterium]